MGKKEKFYEKKEVMMKKGEQYEVVFTRQDFPMNCHAVIDDCEVVVKKGIVGQKALVRVTRKKDKVGEGKIVQILEKSNLEDTTPLCPHFFGCGGCSYQTLSYKNQLELKQKQVKELLDSLNIDYIYEEIKASPNEWGYRNKMEFSFGDEFKNGPLTLGMHKQGNFYDIMTTNQCKIVNDDYNLILDCVLDFATKKELKYVKKLSHNGYLRHLLVRRTAKTKEILICLVTTTQEEHDLTELVNGLLALELDGKIAGILHTYNDSLADVVQNDKTDILYGQDYFYEEILGLRFKISTFSFFQTNSLGAEVLYSLVRDYVGETKDKVIFDLYSGTGTIAQIAAPVAKKVIGVEIIEEAVEAAKENAKLNGLGNCEFIAGDVLKTLDEIKDKPEIIILDPPREGINPKALVKILDYDVDSIVYISCKPTSLVKDLEVMLARGYKLVKACAVDMFPQGPNVETVCLLRK
ncbi:MAG: methyltransferase, TrmA family [Clostridiales bacterium]|jgi:23S rRNA (uracil-5-)-methyltransferase RumA|nr:methyltransferase, TrmA family [Clostridiales bacterium]